jgi:serine/threonine-protein kinase
VLEYVDGLQITEYCKANNLSVRDRVVLVIEVLRALHHAHQHLVVHRDVKPSNILVSEGGNVSLLDFGIAKLLDPESMPGVSTMTRTGVSLLTPGYGSPEQHAGETITTASDVYQVGLVLYELLTGERPFDGSSSRQRKTLPVPSRILRGKPGFKTVRGDLDAIVSKAAHSDRSQRYSSANEMVVDLRRYLDGLPVIAQPDSVGYRLRKLIRRNPWLLPVCLVGAIGAIAYVVTLTRHNQELQVEQRRASAAQDFLVELLRSPDPYAPADSDRGSKITVVEALDIGVTRLHSGAYEDPTLKLSLLTSIGDVYGSLDQHERAIELREEAIRIQRDIFGEISAPVISSARSLANQYATIGDYARAEELFDEQLEHARKYYASSDPELGVAEASAGAFQVSLGNRTGGEQLMQSGVDKMRREPEKYARPLINAVADLASVRSANGCSSNLPALTTSPATRSCATSARTCQ